jgi:hypothetical protein
LPRKSRSSPFSLSVDSRFDGHECFRQKKPDHYTGGGGGYFARGTVLLWSLPDIMSELQDKVDRGEITLKEYYASWIAQMAENERLHPDIQHGRPQIRKCRSTHCLKNGSMIVSYGL